MADPVSGPTIMASTQAVIDKRTAYDQATAAVIAAEGVLADKQEDLANAKVELEAAIDTLKSNADTYSPEE